jgi:hypothetical protein
LPTLNAGRGEGSFGGLTGLATIDEPWRPLFASDPNPIARERALELP